MTREEFTALADRYYDEFASLPDAPNFYDYEKSFDSLFTRMAQEFMEKQLNESSSTMDRRKKKHLPGTEKSPY